MKSFQTASTLVLSWAISGLMAVTGSHAEDYIKSDTLEYMKLMLEDGKSVKQIDEKSLSIINNPEKLDRSEITSFADAFLWASGVRSILSTSQISRLNIVYLHDFPERERISANDGLYYEIYTKNLEAIRDNGPCARVDISSDKGKKYTIVYLDAKQNYDSRLSCIYRHFRSLYGISEKYQMRDYSSTFVADLRLLRCMYKEREDDPLAALSAGRC